MATFFIWLLAFLSLVAGLSGRIGAAVIAVLIAVIIHKIFRARRAA